MCRHKGYTPEQEVHLSHWHLEEGNQSYADHYATEYMQSSLTAGIPIIMRHEDGTNISVDAFWGILPPWKPTKKEAITAAVNFVNIRSETVHESKLYSPLLKKKQRCLIPCSYYFEHHHFHKYNKKTGEPLKGKVSVPFLVKVNRRALFAVPALFSHWYDKEKKETITTYSMITIVANDLLTAVHNGGDNPYRIPLVIEPDMEDAWLSLDSPEKDINEILNYQIHSGQLRTYPVAPLTGKQAKTGEAITEEEAWTEYKTEIEEIKDAGKQKTRVNALQPV